MKNYFFATMLVLAVSLSGCDGSGDQVTSGDSGSTVPGGPLGAPHCAVPTPKFPRPGLSTTPKGGYQWLANYPTGFTCAPYGVQPGGGYWPSNCSDPVDGFTDGSDSDWCCVLTTRTTDPEYVYAVLPALYCPGWGLTSVGDNANADVALCSTAGEFVGWKCAQKM